MSTLWGEPRTFGRLLVAGPLHSAGVAKDDVVVIHCEHVWAGDTVSQGAEAHGLSTDVALE